MTRNCCAARCKLFFPDRLHCVVLSNEAEEREYIYSMGGVSDLADNGTFEAT